MTFGTSVYTYIQIALDIWKHSFSGPQIESDNVPDFNVLISLPAVLKALTYYFQSDKENKKVHHSTNPQPQRSVSQKLLE